MTRRAASHYEPHGGPARPVKNFRDGTALVLVCVAFRGSREEPQRVFLVPVGRKSRPGCFAVDAVVHAVRQEVVRSLGRSGDPARKRDARPTVPPVQRRNGSGAIGTPAITIGQPDPRSGPHAAAGTTPHEPGRIERTAPDKRESDRRQFA